MGACPSSQAKSRRDEYARELPLTNAFRIFRRRLRWKARAKTFAAYDVDDGGHLSFCKGGTEELGR
jgi:hypothetical protein